MKKEQAQSVIARVSTRLATLCVIPGMCLKQVFSGNESGLIQTDMIQIQGNNI